MKVNKLCLLFVLCLFSNQSFALFQSGFDYKEITGDLKHTPKCQNKEEASKHASTGYRFKKQTKVLCQKIGYGWRFSKVENRGEIVCEPCESTVKNIRKYQCYVKNITLTCVLTRRGW